MPLARSSWELIWSVGPRGQQAPAPRCTDSLPLWSKRAAPSQDPVHVGGARDCRPCPGDIPASLGPSHRKHMESKQLPHPQGLRVTFPPLKASPQPRPSILGVALLQPHRERHPGQGYPQARGWSWSDPAPSPVPSEVAETPSLPWLCPLNAWARRTRWLLPSVRTGGRVCWCPW